MKVNLLQDPKFKKFIEDFGARAKAAKELPIDEVRKLSSQFFLSENVVYETIFKIENVEILGSDGHKIPLRIFIPNGSKELPALVYFHRGGWVFGSIEESDSVCRKLANHLGCIVVSVGYRLAPEFPFPKPLEDCYAAAEWAAQNVASDRIIVCGESAGGNLAAAVSLMARDKMKPFISSQLLIYPVILSRINNAVYKSSADQYFLTKESMKYFWSMYLQSPENYNHPYASPNLASLSGLPPAVIITAAYDPLHEEAENYADQLKEAGVKVVAKQFPGVIHGFIDLPIYDEEDKIAWIEEIAQLLKRMN